MRLVHRDPSTGSQRLRLETPSDLWRLARLVAVGDRVGASTTRRDPEAPEDVSGAERVRRRVYLVVRAEQVEFHEFSRHVRITGPIVEGPFDLGRHHTLDVTEGDEVTVAKTEWGPIERALLDEGVRHQGDPVVLIACVDWGDSTLVRLRSRTVEPVADVRRTLAGKRLEGSQAEKDRASYLAELAELVVREGPAATAIVIAGPGFLKEQLAERLRATAPDLARKLTVKATSESGRVGIDELLRSGVAAEALSGSVAAEEAALVERLMRGLGTGLRSAVGPAEVREAVEAGAVETLLLSDRQISDTSIAPLVETLRSTRGRLFIVRGESAAGRRLEALGGIGAILRYDWRPSGIRDDR